MGAADQERRVSQVLRTELRSAQRITSNFHRGADEEELKIVLTPEQVAAILQGQSFGPNGMLANRLWGGAMLLGGALEIAGGGASFLAPEPTMLSKAGGAVLALHGEDTFTTGFDKLWTGEPSKTLTQRAGEGLAYKLHASESQAETAGIVLDIAVCRCR